MKIDSDLIIEILSDELNGESYLTPFKIFNYFQRHPLVSYNIIQFTLKEIGEIVYRVYFNLNNTNENKVYELLSNMVFYETVNFDSIFEYDYPCDNCDRTGYVECEECDGNGEIETHQGDYEPCDECDGGGRHVCNNCEGDGETKESQEYLTFAPNIICDIQPETVIKDMENADTFVDDFDEEMFESKYAFEIIKGDYQYIYESDYHFNPDYEDKMLFYSLVDPNKFFGFSISANF
jgi:hypothetical protein